MIEAVARLVTALKEEKVMIVPPKSSPEFGVAEGVVDAPVVAFDWG